jgi:hypothetical protein
MLVALLRCCRCVAVRAGRRCVSGLLPPGDMFNVPGQANLQPLTLELVLTHSLAADLLKNRNAKRLDVTEATVVLQLGLVTPRAAVPAAPI